MGCCGIDQCFLDEQFSLLYPVLKLSRLFTSHWEFKNAVSFTGLASSVQSFFCVLEAAPSCPKRGQSTLNRCLLGLIW